MVSTPSLQQQRQQQQQQQESKARFKRRATTVLSWLDCSSTAARLGFRCRI